MDHRDAPGASNAGVGKVARKRSGPRVTQYRRTGRWEAHIWISNPRGRGFQRHLGSYNTAEDAARAFDRATIRLRGISDELNFPASEYTDDAFMNEHMKTERFRFLDILRTTFAISSDVDPTRRPGQRTLPSPPEANISTPSAMAAYAPAAAAAAAVVPTPPHRELHHTIYSPEALSASHTAHYMTRNAASATKDDDQLLIVSNGVLASAPSFRDDLCWSPGSASGVAAAPVFLQGQPVNMQADQRFMVSNVPVQMPQIAQQPPTRLTFQDAFPLHEMHATGVDPRIDDLMAGLHWLASSNEYSPGAYEWVVAVPPLSPSGGLM